MGKRGQESRPRAEVRDQRGASYQVKPVPGSGSMDLQIEARRPGVW